MVMNVWKAGKKPDKTFFLQVAAGSEITAVGSNPFLYKLVESAGAFPDDLTAAAQLLLAKGLISQATADGITTYVTTNSEVYDPTANLPAADTLTTAEINSLYGSLVSPAELTALLVQATDYTAP